MNVRQLQMILTFKVNTFQKKYKRAVCWGANDASVGQAHEPHDVIAHEGKALTVAAKHNRSAQAVTTCSKKGSCTQCSRAAAS